MARRDDSSVAGRVEDAGTQGVDHDDGADSFELNGASRANNDVVASAAVGLPRGRLDPCFALRAARCANKTKCWSDGDAR